MKKLIILTMAIVFALNANAQVQMAPYQTFYGGVSPKLVTIADVNGDNRNDVVLATTILGYPSNMVGTLLVYTQDSNGNLNPPAVNPVFPGTANGIDTYDFNGDGNNDVVFCFLDTIKIMESLGGNGNLQTALSIYSGNSPDGVSIGDIDNDGFADIAISHWSSSFIRVLWGNGGFSFADSTYYVQNAGWDEILVSKVGNDSVNSIVFMRGQTLQAGFDKINFNNRTVDTMFTYTTSSWAPNGIAVGDRDNDGFREIAMTWGGNNPSSGIRFFDSISSPMNPTFNLSPVTDNPQSIVASSMDCNPGDEYVVLHGGYQKLSVISDTVVQNFSIPYASNYRPQALDVGDINSDGKNDVVIADYNNGLVVLYNTTPMMQDTLVDTTFTLIVSTFVDTLIPDTTVQVSASGGWEYTETTIKTGVETCIDSSIVESIRTRYLNCSNAYYDSTIHDTTTVYSCDTAYASQTNLDSVWVTPNSIEDINAQESVILYPNPTNDIIYITFSKEDEYQLLLFDGMGKMIRRKTIFSSKGSIDLSNLPIGNYYLKMKSLEGNNLFHKKITKIE